MWEKEKRGSMIIGKKRTNVTLQAGDVRDGVAGPNSRVTVMIFDTQTNFTTSVPRPTSLKDV